MTKVNGKTDVAEAPRVLSVVSSSPWLGKLGAVKVVATAAKASKAIPEATDPGIVDNGNCAYWRDGNMLMLAIDISPETIAASQHYVKKDGKQSPGKTVAKVQGFKGGIDIGAGLSLSLYLGTLK